MAKGLTPLKVGKEKRPGRYADGGGLYLQVGKTGTKAWLFRFQLDGRERFMGLGSVKTFSLKEARLRARAARQVLSDGIDPIEDRLARRDAERKNSAARITFKEAMAKFLATHADLWRNRKHAKQWEVSVRSYAGALMDRPVRAIDTSVINEALAQHWTAHPRNHGPRAGEGAARVSMGPGRHALTGNWWQSEAPHACAALAGAPGLHGRACAQRRGRSPPGHWSSWS